MREKRGKAGRILYLSLDLAVPTTYLCLQSPINKYTLNKLDNLWQRLISGLLWNKPQNTHFSHALDREEIPRMFLERLVSQWLSIGNVACYLICNIHFGL